MNRKIQGRQSLSGRWHGKQVYGGSRRPIVDRVRNDGKTRLSIKSYRARHMVGGRDEQVASSRHGMKNIADRVRLCRLSLSSRFLCAFSTSRLERSITRCRAAICFLVRVAALGAFCFAIGTPGWKVWE